MKSLAIIAFFFFAQNSFASIPEVLYAKISGSCQSGDLRFSALTFTGTNSDSSRTDVYLYLDKSGSANILFVPFDSGIVASTSATTWKELDTGTLEVENFGKLSFVEDPFNPGKFAILAFQILKNDFYTKLSVNLPSQGYLAFLRSSVGWNQEGKTSVEVCKKGLY